jgi:glycosyltransferase involved in cell wall biosynthesis
MIIVYHNDSCITKIVSKEGIEVIFDKKKTISFGLMKLAIQFPESKLMWCHKDFQEQINIGAMPELMHHQKMMLSFDPSESNYLGREIGYVEESPFINVNKKVSYPTWQMSSKVGGINAIVLLAFKSKIKLDSDFDYYLNSIAKVGMPLGLLCYSEPKLFIETAIKISTKGSVFTLFKFVKQHYKTRWIFLLLLNLLVYEFRFPFVAFIYALFFRNRNKLPISLVNIPVQSNKIVVQKATIDVIIPTIGRKKYLYDVLQDLKKQTHLPINVIIVEQNPQKDSVSELDYLHKEKWPFVIKHTFTHQAGACNARNLALSQVESEWVFMADDDIRIDDSFVKQALGNINKTSIYAGVFRCNLIDQTINYNGVSQTTIFGSGCSIVKKASLCNLSFNKKLEFGYGEDTDFGLQLRNIGVDVIYFPEPSILHLKAPIGGFRIKTTFAWSGEMIQPKPSPSIMCVKNQYDSKEQLLGYKLTFFLKSFKKVNVINCISYFVFFQKKWKASVHWAKMLKDYD